MNNRTNDLLYVTTYVLGIFLATMIFVFLVTSRPSHGQEFRYTCEDVRRAYVQYGGDVLRAWGKEYGVSPSARRAAVRCIHSKRIVFKPNRRRE